jgi:hypothetical protein
VDVAKHEPRVYHLRILVEHLSQRADDFVERSLVLGDVASVRNQIEQVNLVLGIRQSVALAFLNAAHHE